MKVKFYLRGKLSKSAELSIWCYVREFKGTIYLNTGQKINPSLWDNKLQRANPRLTRDNITKGYIKSLNQFLNAFENKIFDIERNIRKNKFNTSFNVIADAIKKQFDIKKDGLFDVYDEFLKIKRQEVSKQAIIKFNRIKSLLLEYQKKSNEILDFDKITPVFFQRFYAFMIEDKNMLNNTANKNIQFLKTFLIWCNTNGYTENSSYKSFKGKFEANEIVYLTEEELMTLYNLQLNNERLERVRDIFVYQCFTGVRYSDIENISREDIKNSVWNVRTQKTHQIIGIPLSSYALSILAKYNEYPQPLPIISNQKMNKYLKELCKLAGIDEPIKIVKYKGNERIEKTFKKYELVGTHTARRTFVSLSLQKGMKPEEIMAITGHTTYKMMSRYLKIDFGSLRNAVDKTWGNSLRIVEKK